MPTDDKTKVEAYLEKQPEFSRVICEKLRSLILAADPEIKETYKWSAPVYEKNGLICAIGAFKKHVRLSFFQGAYLSDPKKILPEGTGNASMRSVNFTQLSQVNEDAITEYVREATLIKPVKLKVPARPLVIPADLEAVLNAHSEAKHIFDKMAHTHRKEYIMWITEAKKPETRERRLNQTVERLLAKKKI